MSTSRAARDTRGTWVRLLLLSGIAAVAWLAGAFGAAHADTSPETGGLVSRVMGAGDAAEHTVRAAGPREPVLTGAAARAASTTSALADTVVPQAAAFPAHALDDTGLTEALDDTAAGAATHRVVGDTARTVDGTARGAGDLVSGVARAGRGVVESTDDSLREGGLVDTVTEGLADTADAGVGDSVRRTVFVDPPVLGAEGEPATVSEGSRHVAPDAARDRDEDPAADSGAAAPAVSPETVWHAAATPNSGEETGDDASADRVHLIAGGAPHSAGTDATGASAPSFPTPGAAGFLMARAVHTAPQAQRSPFPATPPWSSATPRRPLLLP
ncbi:hypothetical protein [Nocardiopsis sp. CNR-923]|uniref:hypothetical protein n=1 Tax=Nocardiopsis sp. CNR-923 TaxID=1904965 RepID=UPI0029165EE6|nr:hypothetical protein [Nocardiopsis sp. CNR-923]